MLTYSKYKKSSCKPKVSYSEQKIHDINKWYIVCNIVTTQCSNIITIGVVTIISTLS